MKMVVIVCAVVALVSLPGIWEPGWEFYLVANIIVDAVIIFTCRVLNRLAGN